MTRVDRATLERVAREAALLGGRMAREAFDGRADPATTAVKDGHFDIVTETDSAVEEAITAYLLSEVPQSRILGEEGGWVQSEDWDEETGVTWLIDPIDGTSNFASGLPIFATSVGAIRAGRPIAGAVYEPMLDQLMWVSGGEVLVGDRPFRWSTEARNTQDVELLTNSPYERYGLPQHAVAPYRDMLRSFRAVRRLGACTLHVSYVAAGFAAACFEYDFHAWDVAAGLHLAESSGCTIQAWGSDGELLVSPSSHPELVKSLLVTAPGLDSAAVDWVQARVATSTSTDSG